MVSTLVSLLIPPSFIRHSYIKKLIPKRLDPGKIYHVYNRGNNRQAIFFEPENYRYFLAQLDKYLSGSLSMLSYCLMPNHFHLLVRIKVKDGKPDVDQSKLVVKLFKDFFIAYAKAINKKYGRTGALFQSTFKRKEIDNDYYFSWLIQYIHYNPIKATLCKNFEDWKYSSYNAIISKQPTKVAKEEVLAWFGDVEEFIRVHNERIIDEEKFKQYLFHNKH